MCGCLFLKDDLENGEEVATCPSCSLIVRVIYDKVRKPKFGHLALLSFPVYLSDLMLFALIFRRRLRAESL